jgi:CubicO group peptidase (beta-lactamase class C family)
MRDWSEWPRRARAAGLCVAFGGWMLSCAPATIDAHVSIPVPVPKPSVATMDAWPTQGWQVSSPEAQGIDSSVLADALEQIQARHIPVHSLLIERHGEIVLDSYFYPFSDNQTHNVYSVTKSVTSMLVGIAMSKHQLADLNAPVFSLLPDDRSDDPRKAHITLAHLLSMTSGLDCHPQGNETLLQQMLHSPHLAAYMLSRPSDAEPGTVFDYCGGNSEVVSAVLTKSTGTSALEYARRELFAPLGITRVSWPTDSDGVSHGWGDLRLAPRDMAKLGYLWLHNGRWEDKQVVPSDYLAQALTSHISVQPGIAYGYGMWLYPGHTPVDFEANGTGGQRITVIPSLDMVEVVTGGGLDANRVAALIAAAPKSNDALPANPSAEARLNVLIAQAASPVATTADNIVSHRSAMTVASSKY